MKEILCTHCREMLFDYVSDNLDLSKSNMVKRHITSCSECNEEFKAISEMLLVLSNVPEPELPLDFESSLHEKLVAEAKLMKPVAEEKKWKFSEIIKEFNLRTVIPSAVVCVFAVCMLSTGMYNWFKDDEVILTDDLPVSTSAPVITTAAPVVEGEVVNSADVLPDTTEDYAPYNPKKKQNQEKPEIQENAKAEIVNNNADANVKQEEPAVGNVDVSEKYEEPVVASAITTSESETAAAYSIPESETEECAPMIMRSIRRPEIKTECNIYSLYLADADKYFEDNGYGERIMEEDDMCAIDLTLDEFQTVQEDIAGDEFVLAPEMQERAEELFGGIPEDNIRILFCED